MKVFWTPVKPDTNTYGDPVKVGTISDDKAYARALKAYDGDKDLVSEALDGRGWITIQGVNGYFTYQQDDL